MQRNSKHSRQQRDQWKNDCAHEAMEQTSKFGKDAP